MSEFDLASTDRLLTTTRTVRKRLDLAAPVDSTTVLECLEIATQAPSGGNGQRWRWVFVRDPQLKATIHDFYAAAYEEYSAPLRPLVKADDVAGQRIVGSSDHLAEHLAEVPLLVIPCVLERLGPEASRREQASLYGGIFPAVWSFQLALRTRGYGSAITTLHIAYEREIGELLGIPETVTQVALLPVARYTGETFQAAARKPVDEVVYVDRWKRRPADASPST
jgi:nitroreductase